MKIVARDKNFSILIQVAEVINLKYTRFIIYRMLGSDCGCVYNRRTGKLKKMKRMLSSLQYI